MKICWTRLDKLPIHCIGSDKFQIKYTIQARRNEKNSWGGWAFIKNVGQLAKEDRSTEMA